MSDQETKALKALLPTAGGNRAFDRGLVEGLEAAAKALAGLPAESLEPLRTLTALAVEQERYHREVIARLDTPESRREVEERLAKIRSGEIKMVPLEPLLRELGILEDNERNGAVQGNGT
jgi:hypothetical protein